MENEVLITGIFVGAGLLAYVIIHSLYGTGSSITWKNRKGVRPEMEKTVVFDYSGTGDQKK